MISIIITAFNVEETIGRAIESCLSQSFYDLQIIVINDCSTDNTANIVNSYTDQRIEQHINKTNLGAGLSRRLGTKLSKGEYTLFLDGDDYIDQDMILTLYDKAIQYNADVVSSGMRIIENELCVNEITYNLEEIMNGKEGLFASSVIKRWLNNKLIRRDLWDKVLYSARRFVEDTLTCFEILYFTDVLVNLPYIGYNYVQNSNSLCHTTSSLKRSIYSILAAKDMCMFLKDKNLQEYFDALCEFMHIMFNFVSLKCEETVYDYLEEWDEICNFVIDNKDLIFIPIQFLISDKYKYIYCLISKNGCSTMLASIYKDDFNIELDSSKKAWYQELVYKNEKYISAKIYNPKFADFSNFKNYRKFVVVRDDTDRFISYINNTYKENEYNKFFDKSLNKEQYINQVINLYDIQMIIDRHATPLYYYIYMFKQLFGDELEIVNIKDLDIYYKELTTHNITKNNITDNSLKICTKETIKDYQLYLIEQIMGN